MSVKEEEKMEGKLKELSKQVSSWIPLSNSGFALMLMTSL
jgi:hypothetical protein